MKNRFFVIVLLICIFAQSAIFASTDTLSEIYNEDFSSCKPGELPDKYWVSEKNNNDAVGVIMYHDAKIMKIAKGAAGDVGNTGTKIYLPNTIKNRTVIDMDVMASSTKINFGAMYVMGSDGKSLICCTFNNLGTIGIYYNNKWNYSAEYTAGQWYNLKADIDLQKHTFQFFINGKLVAEDETTRSNGDNVAIVNSFVNTVNTAAYIGSIKITGAELGDEQAVSEVDGNENKTFIDYSDNRTMFEDDFESYETGEYTGDFGAWKFSAQNGGKATVIEDNGNKAVRVSKSETDGKGACSLTFELDKARSKSLWDTVVTVEYRIKSEDSSKFIGGPYINSRTSTPSITVGFNGQGIAYANSTASPLGSYSSGEWYNIKLVMDFSAKVFDAYVDGKPKIVTGSFRSINSMDVKTIRFYVEAAGAATVIDDFKITTSNNDFPASADNVAEIEKTTAGDTASYIITDEYISTRMSVSPPVILDSDGYNTEKFTIKSEAVARLVKYEQDLTIREDDLRIIIPYKVFDGLNNGKDLTLIVNKNHDPNILWRRINNKSELVNVGKAFSIRISSDGDEIAKLNDKITLKQSGCISGKSDSRITVIEIDDSGSYKAVISKHDPSAKGVMFKTDTCGDFLVVRNLKSFGDVPNSHWAYEYIKSAAAREIIKGYDDGSFRPETGITKGEAAVIFANAIGLNRVEYDKQFEDISGDEFYAPYVAALCDSGIIDRELVGSRYYPSKSASRTDIAYLAVNTYYYVWGRNNDCLTKFYIDGSYEDINSIPKEFCDYVKAAYVMDFMRGRDGKFCPSDSITRAETLRVVSALLKAVQFEDSGLDVSNAKLTDLYTFPFTYKSYYTYISKNRLNGLNENGAYGENVRYENGEADKWYIEEQRNIDDDILPEILRKRYLGNSSGDPELVSQLMRAVEWGFLRQDETGGFEGSGDKYQSTAFFIEEIGRILLLMKESGDSAYDIYLDKYIDKLHNAALWMISDEEFMSFYNAGYYDIYTHRYFAYSCGLLCTYKLTGDTRLRDKAHQLLLEGISHMTKEGVLPEKGGFDVGYGVTSIHSAYRCMFVCDDDMIRSELKDMTLKATQYIVNMLDNKGNIDLSTSTRTNGQETKRDGVTLKTVSERSLYNSLLAAASVSEEGDIVTARDQMAVRQKYLTSAYLEYRDNEYDLSSEKFAAPNAPTTGNDGQTLTQLPVKAYKVSEEYGNRSHPENMFSDNYETGWYVRKLPQYVDIDLGIVREIGMLDIAFADTNKRKYTYSVLISDDGENWKYCTTDITTKDAKINTVQFPYAEGRYVRIWIQKIEPMFQEQWFTDIRNIKVYGVDKGEDIDFQPINNK